MDEYEHYWKLSEMEERFNSSSGGIRGLASAWLLAALGSIGWLFSAYDYEKWPFPLGFLIIIVATMASLGFATLWIMDQLVFHRLLNSVFLVGLKMEKDDSKLPPIRSMMMKTQEGSGTQRWERLFYIGPMWLFLLFSLFLVFSGTDKLFAPNTELFRHNTRLISGFLVIFQLISLVFVISNMTRVSSFKKRASWFNDDEFLEMISSSSYESTIANFGQKKANNEMQ